MNFAIVGAGFSGAVLASELSNAGHSVDLFESREHIGGNCYTERDTETGILIHKYGPHIFHTDSEEVWAYVNNLSEFIPFVNRVKTNSQGRIFSLPVNLHTINQFFGKTFRPDEAKRFIESIADQKIGEPQSFREQALKFIGKDLYMAFFEGYTEKQWGIDADDLPATILKRLPVRFNYDDNYYNHKYQGMPRNGYTCLVEKLLQNKKITVRCQTKFENSLKGSFDHVFYTGAIDSWFNFEHGRLAYRTLDFTREVHDGDYQGCAVMNYGDRTIPYTRISEHKHFSPWELHQHTVIFKEYSRLCGEEDVPYYPIRLVREKSLLKLYVESAKKERHISFLGRLGTYRYLDMDVTISEALQASRHIQHCIRNGETIPAFFVNPE